VSKLACNAAEPLYLRKSYAFPEKFVSMPRLRPPLTKTTDDIALSAAAAAERFWVVDGKAELFRK